LSDNQEENILPVELGDEMQTAYLDYAMSVIIGRALPDVRDGLKPVHRRTLYSMIEGGLSSSSSYRKCARVVGDVMGRYHPHGDCLHPDTTVFLVNGGFAPIKDLVGKSHDVLCLDMNTKNLRVVKAHSFRIGQHTNKIYNVNLSNNATVRVTANHPFLLSGKTWCKAEELRPGVALWTSEKNMTFSSYDISISDELYIVSVEIEDVNNFPMYDFTVDDHENMLIPVRQVNNGYSMICIHNSSCYDTLVHMAQDFSYRYELVDGHGNFGSIDGDSAAAMRYTECRLAKTSMEILADLKKDTVDFVDNYDGSSQEPTVLPSKFPNFLVNGSSGIAVGMATNAPPHNLKEVVRGIIAVIDDPEIQISRLMQKIKGPDFPTGGVIVGREGIREAYKTGRGIITVRGKAHVEENSKGKGSIVITEIPYQVNKAKLIEKIAKLVREKKINDISNLRDESDMSGIRLVVDLKQGSVPQVVINQLQKHTQMQVSFGIINIALVNEVPKLLPLIDTIKLFIEHRNKVIIRRTKFDLKKAEDRAHIIEGLLKALDNIDQVIKIIKESKDVETAKKRLIKEFGLTDIQTQAILDMKLQKLTGLETKKLKDELEELKTKIKELKAILKDPGRVLQIIKDELEEISRIFGDNRRTEIVDEEGEFSVEDLIAEEEMVVTISHGGYVKRVPVHNFKRQKRGGKGVIGMDLKDEDWVDHFFVANTHHFVLFFSNKGKVYKLKVYELPEGTRVSKGKHVANFLPLATDEKIVDTMSVRDFDENHYLVLATKDGIVKKTPLSKYDSARKDGIIALTLKDNDEVIKAFITDGNSEIMLVSYYGQAIKFPEKQVRSVSRTAVGVKGIKLREDDRVLTMVIPGNGNDLLVITGNGYGKRTLLEKYRNQKRGGVGVKTVKLIDSKGELIGARVVGDKQELIVTSQEGIVIRIPVKDIPRTSRTTQGARIMRVVDGDKVSAMGIVAGTEPPHD
jgi:DNA gyrase subunit A